MIIAIDVKHLVSLDTENTVYQINDKQLELPAVHKVREEQHTQTEHTPSTLRRGKVSHITYHRGVATNIPVPSTTTSYSGAMSSMVIRIWQEEDIQGKIKQNRDE